MRRGFRKEHLKNVRHSENERQRQVEDELDALNHEDRRTCRTLATTEPLHRADAEFAAFRALQREQFEGHEKGEENTESDRVYVDVAG